MGSWAESRIACDVLACVLSSRNLRRMFQLIALPLWAVVGPWRTARARCLLGLCVGTLLQRRLDFLARITITWAMSHAPPARDWRTPLRARVGSCHHPADDAPERTAPRL